MSKYSTTTTMEPLRIRRPNIIKFPVKQEEVEDEKKSVLDTDCKREDVLKEIFYKELNEIMDNWCTSYDDIAFSGGKMRGARGEDIENMVRRIINRVGEEYGLNIKAVKGSEDKKELKLEHNGRQIKKDHQVDIHIYKNDVMVAVIECKAYLDSCYYVRACDDFTLFKKFGYDIKKYIFALEDSIDVDTKVFTDVITDYVCDDIFYMLDGKRTSTKPIYDKKHRKEINREKVDYFIDRLCKLLL